MQVACNKELSVGRSSGRTVHPSLVPASFSQAADEHWRTMNIHRLDGTLWLAARCNIMLMRAASVVGLLLS